MDEMRPDSRTFANRIGRRTVGKIYSPRCYVVSLLEQLQLFGIRLTYIYKCFAIRLVGCRVTPNWFEEIRTLINRATRSFGTDFGDN